MELRETGIRLSAAPIAERALTLPSEFDRAIEYLSTKGIEAFEENNILVIPAESPEHLDRVAKTIKRYLQECGYDKSWKLDPYYIQHRELFTA